MPEIKMKRFLALGVCVRDGDTKAVEEGQFDTQEEAEALVDEFNSDEKYTCGEFRYFWIDLWPDYQGGHN